jgi:hypothetical protein
MRPSIVSLEVNGAHRDFLVQPGATLLSALRESLGLTATRKGCETGSCGACTVLVDGDPVMSCLCLVEPLDGAHVETLEGVATGPDELHPIQQAFIDGFATQCGFCNRRDDHGGEGADRPQSEPEPRGRNRRHLRQRLPLHRLRGDHRRDPRGGGGPARRPPLPRGMREGANMEDILTQYFADERGEPLKVVGTTVERSDARGHVTGRTQFYEDVSFPGMLHLKMVRSTRHHALIKHIDARDALAVPGVVRVITHKDVPHNWYTILRLIGVEPNDEPVLPEDRVLFLGEQICAVLAETQAAAEEGASKVVIDYEDLPAVFDVEEALKPETPAIKPHGKNYFVYEGHHCRRIRFGDVEAAFAGADHVVEHRYQSAPIEHAPTETTGCIVKPEGSGRFTVYSNTQALFFTLDNMALILGLPFGKLRLVGGTVGGGFGGKVDVIVEPIATLAAMLTGKPVKYAYSRWEEMQVSSPRAAERLYIKDGVMNDARSSRAR